MNIILKVLNIFFVVLGIIFFLLVVSAACLWWANPYGMVSSGAAPTLFMNMMTGNTTPVKVDNVDKNPLLNEQQEAQLEGLGIDPATLPSQITPAMEACFTAKLGQERTNQIIQGSAPTPADFFKTQSCF